MKTRLISTFCMLPLLVFVWLGGIPLFLVCAVLSTMGLWEFYRGFENININPSRIIGFGSAILFYVIMFFSHFAGKKLEGNTDYILAWLFLTVFCSLFLSLTREDHNILDGPATILGVVYVTFCLVHVSLVTTLEDGNSLKWLVFIIAFGTDTMAYCGGLLFGKHKLCPNLSPKKTIEGAVSGVIGAVVFSVLFAYFAMGKESIPFVAAMSLIGSPISQCGDLIASSFKRKMGIKDYSNLIPGHGGIMDRFDSVAMVAPFVYYFALVF